MRHLIPLRRYRFFLVTMAVVSAAILVGCQGNADKDQEAKSSKEVNSPPAKIRDQVPNLAHNQGVESEGMAPQVPGQNPWVSREKAAVPAHKSLPKVPFSKPDLMKSKANVGQLRSQLGSSGLSTPPNLKPRLKAGQHRLDATALDNPQFGLGSETAEVFNPKPRTQMLPLSPSPPNAGASKALANESIPTDAQFQRSLAMLQDNDGPTKVEVFFATDRKLVGSVSANERFKIFLWPAILLLSAAIMALWALTAKRILPIAICIVAIIAGTSVGYTAMIKWQRIARVDRNQDVRFTHQLSNENTTEDLLHYGKCLVNIPTDHRVGIVDSPSLKRFEFSENEDKHVILERVISGPRSGFFDDLNDRLETSTGHAFVFIHGYNVSFENAVKRTAQIAYDLKFGGVPVCYSWPSHGGLQDYTRDMANADWTVIHLQHFLNALFQETRAKRIHLIAHSMGNRALMQALERLSFEWAQEASAVHSLTEHATAAPEVAQNPSMNGASNRQFGQIIMAAPDISAHDF